MSRDRKPTDMSSPEDGTVEQAHTGLETIISVTIGATVPTGFEHTAAEEVHEKIGVEACISKDRGRIYFTITTDKLFQVHLLRSVDNLFVVVDEYDQYQFKESKEETLAELQQLASKLPWTNALEVWKLNRTFKKRKGQRKGASGARVKPSSEVGKATPADGKSKAQAEEPPIADDPNKTEESRDTETSTQGSEEAEPDVTPKIIKFRVTCNRAGDKHSFSSNEAARDFGGAVQEFFQWKADMTKFDIEVLLNIHNTEVVIGIALTEESLHRRNISHFGPTTLRSTLCYGMLRLCKPQPSDIILDPMCGTGAIPLEGALEFPASFYICGDNNDMAVNRTVNNVCHIQKRKADKGGLCPEWGDCGGSSTLFGSMLVVYTPVCSCSGGPAPCLAKLPKISMNHEGQRVHKKIRTTASALRLQFYFCTIPCILDQHNLYFVS
ncbi:THUMP domain-containing protein 3 isoform X3 [Phycodurus eques]|uniref:THUMP domain-containing protein 3 isoform X3 n=1 Tax=Phycodurus eques TaxID=693459 RepID=UPI002ACEC8F6|nr:THUMP domain-containing protein 3 isoform X3 [Phycodurus eques]